MICVYADVIYRTGIIFVMVHVPSISFSILHSHWTLSVLFHSGMMSIPPVRSWSIRGCGTNGAAAHTTVTSYGACEGLPSHPFPCSMVILFVSMKPGLSRMMLLMLRSASPFILSIPNTLPPLLMRFPITEQRYPLPEPTTSTVGFSPIIWSYKNNK